LAPVLDVFVLELGLDLLVTPVAPTSCVMDMEQLMPLVPLVLALQELIGLLSRIVLSAILLTARMEQCLMPLALLVSTALLLGLDLPVKFAAFAPMELLMLNALLVLVILTGEALLVISVCTLHVHMELSQITPAMDVPAPEPSSLDRTVMSVMMLGCVIAEDIMIQVLPSVLDVSAMTQLPGEVADAKTVSIPADPTEETMPEESVIDALALLHSLETELIAITVTPMLFATVKV